MGRAICFMVVLPVLVLGTSAALRATEPGLRLEVLSPEVEQYGLIQFALEPLSVDAEWGDSQAAALSLVIRTPQGRTCKLPAFRMQPYERETVPRSGRPVAWMYPVGDPVWRARFAPAEVGCYQAVAEWYDGERRVTSLAVKFRCTASGSPGFVRVSPQDPRYFEFDNGQPFFPVGQNLAFIGEGQYVTLPKMEQIFERLATHGANWLRIWTCCQDWALAIEARKSAWGRSWNGQSPIVPLPGQEVSGRKCLQMSAEQGDSLSVSPSHPVALRPSTSYCLTGRIKTTPEMRVQVITGRHRLETDVTSGSQGEWQTFRLQFETDEDEYWLGRTRLQWQGNGSAWLDALSLRESNGGPELLWEANVNRQTRGFYNPVDCFMLDQIVTSAQQHGIYLQLCLLTRDLYMDALTDQHSPEYQQAIDDAQKLLRYAVARWGYATAVVSWEYFNEQNPGLPTNRFYRELGQYLQRVDPYRHLRATSAWHPSPRDWQHPQLDVADTHFYLRPAPERKYVDEVQAARGNAAELRRHTGNKPALLGEFGLANAQWQPTNEMQESREVIDFHNGIWASALSGVSGTAMFWWWERLDQRNHYPHYRPLADFVADIPWTTANLQTARVRAVESPVRALGLAGRDQAYLWLFDPQASFESVVMRGVVPREFTDVEVQLRGLADNSYEVQWWNTRTGDIISRQSVAVSDRLLRLNVPPFTRDLAAKIRLQLDAERERGPQESTTDAPAASAP